MINLRQTISSIALMAAAWPMCAPALGQVAPAAPPAPAATPAPAASPEDFSEWVNNYLYQTVQGAKARASEATRPDVETPSVSQGSTSIVDKSAFGTLANLAANFLGFGPSVSPGADGSLTATLYQLQNVASSRDLLNPTSYDNSFTARHISFTLGPDTVKLAGGTTDQRAVLLGSKYTFLDDRDLTHNKAETNKITTALDNLTGALSGPGLTGKLYGLLNDRGELPPDFVNNEDAFRNASQNTTTFQQKIEPLLAKPEIEADLGTMIETAAGPQYSALQSAIRDAIAATKTGTQMAVAFQTEQAVQGGFRKYKGELTYDGTLSGLSLTGNAFGSQQSGGASSNGTGGGISLDLTVMGGKTDPVTLVDKLALDLSASSQWLSSDTPAYQAQGKLTIPIMKGIDLPFSITAANKSSLLKEKYVEGRIGFSFDLSKLQAAAGKDLPGLLKGLLTGSK